ncbi:hypothetical protein PRUPE_1G188600 [Prunus persica]|uniref:Uncharacterized protein n=1 Tax=Prunus persica TaxID=3760 RepID=A0A251R0L7_PRUPE|nr:hypothetical protein PRUPE_6G140500 [Prunus persica]ONI01454.1 hypothetical protein PRUPE_6G140500 [Prunus persica]ONI13358.1 hypothetical protein PRUPE_4G217400 [Prunus persica]ONI13359.1 hypothetical protein PRUPE_4G217400 [Prunus persica]ONI13360.1 hypothetical protein PRUPE_4G217400 [Prunus persica]
MVLCSMYVSAIVRLDFILVGSLGFDFLWLDMTEWGGKLGFGSFVVAWFGSW